MSRASAKAQIRAWFSADLPTGRWEDDRAVSDWFGRSEAVLRGRLASLSKDAVAAAIVREAEKDKAAAADALVAIMATLEPAARDEVLAKLRAL